jgi:hypothetical protein
MDKLPVRNDGGLLVEHSTGALPGLKVMVDRATRWKFAWQQSLLAACPQEVKDGVKDGTKVGGARSPARTSRRQNRGNPGPCRVGQVGVVEWSAHRTALWPGSALFQDRREVFKHALSLSLYHLWLRHFGSIRSRTRRPGAWSHPTIVSSARSWRKPVCGGRKRSNQKYALRSRLNDKSGRLCRPLNACNWSRIICV